MNSLVKEFVLVASVLWLNDRVAEASGPPKSPVPYPTVSDCPKDAANVELVSWVVESLELNSWLADCTRVASAVSAASWRVVVPLLSTNRTSRPILISPTVSAG